MTNLERYCTDIVDGRIVACNKMKQISEILLNRLYNPGEYHFDHEEAERHIRFIETFCKQPSGKIGQPLKLELFQKARLEAVFGFVDDNGTRQTNEVLIIEGRKNGKTSECAAVEIDMLLNAREGAPQIYNVATTRDQALLGFNAAHKMIQQSPALSKHIRKRVNDLYFPPNFGFIKALASNTNSMDGLDTFCAIVDELSAIASRDTYDLIKQSMGARKTGPLLFQITTNGFRHGGSLFDAQYEYAANILNGTVKNERFLPFIYELDSVDEWDDPEAWIKANPGLGTIKSCEYLAEMVQKAKDDPSFKPTVLVKDFNMPQTAETSWLRYEELNNETKAADILGDYKFDYCIGGFDAADSVDICAAKAICKRPGDDHVYVRSMYWLPQEVIARQEAKGDRRERDGVPYSLWIKQGLMRTTPGNKVDKRAVLEWFKELRDVDDLYTLFIGYDPWHVSDELLAEFRAEFGQLSMVPVRQGVLTLSEPMKSLGADFRSGLIIYDNNPIDKWCLMNTEIKTDVNGNIQPTKGRTQTNRIDGTAALLDAYVVLQDKKNQYINLNK